MGNAILDSITPPVLATIAVITDVHSMGASSTKALYCQQRLPQLVTAVNKHKFQLLVDAGDALQGLTAGVNGLTYGDFSAQAAVYSIVQSGIAGPKLNVLGNHDIYYNATYSVGFDINTTMTTLGMSDGRYGYRDIVGTNVRVIGLYSYGLNMDVHSGPYGLGATQMAWLTALLTASADKYVILVSHNPIVSAASALWYIQNYQRATVLAGDYNLTSDNDNNPYPMTSLIFSSACVKACISGHEHIPEVLQFPGIRPDIKFINGGSPAANYWNPEKDWFGHKAGYGMVSVFQDGSVQFNFYTY